MLGHEALVLWFIGEVITTFLGATILFMVFSEALGVVLYLENTSFIQRCVKYMLSIFIICGLFTAIYVYSSEFLFTILPFLQFVAMISTFYGFGGVLSQRVSERKILDSIVLGFFVLVSILAISGWFVRMILPPADMEYVVRLLFGG